MPVEKVSEVVGKRLFDIPELFQLVAYWLELFLTGPPY